MTRCVDLLVRRMWLTPSRLVVRLTTKGVWELRNTDQHTPSVSLLFSCLFNCKTSRRFTSAMQGFSASGVYQHALIGNPAKPAYGVGLVLNKTIPLRCVCRRQIWGLHSNSERKIAWTAARSAHGVVRVFETRFLSNFPGQAQMQQQLQSSV